MIYCSDKKTVEEYYYCSPFIPDTTTQPNNTTVLNYVVNSTVYET